MGLLLLYSLVEDEKNMARLAGFAKHKGAAVQVHFPFEIDMEGGGKRERMERVREGEVEGVPAVGGAGWGMRMCMCVQLHL
jgi:hypothetical protein